MRESTLLTEIRSNLNPRIKISLQTPLFSVLEIRYHSHLGHVGTSSYAGNPMVIFLFHSVYHESNMHNSVEFPRQIRVKAL